MNKGGLGFWIITKMVKESFKESKRGETNEIGERSSIGGDVKKKERQRKEGLQMGMGLGFKKLRGTRKKVF
jgi:hypothetical protein